MNTETFPKKRWLYLALGTAAMLTMGMIYAWSIYKVPLKETFYFTTGQLAFNYSVTFCFFCLGNMFGSWLMKRTCARVVIFVSGLLIGCSYILTGTLQTASIILLYIYFGCFLGLGMGMAYPVILSWVAAWFPDRSGFASGVLMMGFGFSALVLGKPLSMLFDVPGIGWRNTYIITGVMTALVLIICAIVFSKNAPASYASRDKNGNGRQFTPRQVMKRASFWRFFLYGVLISALGSSIFAFGYDYCLSVGASAGLAATLVGILSAFNGLSRMIFGALYDRIGQKKTIICGSSIIVISAVVMLTSVFLHSLPLGILGLCLAGLAYGYGPVMSATTIRTFYGGDNFAANYSLSNTRAFIASFYSPVAAFLLTTFNSFAAPFTLALVCGVAAFFLQFKIREDNI